MQIGALGGSAGERVGGALSPFSDGSRREQEKDANWPFRRDVLAPPGINARLVRDICSLRAARNDYLPANLVSVSAWDILLQLYAAYLEHRRLSIANVVSDTGIAATTALRWIGSLSSAGLVTRSNDPTDARRVFVELSQSGITAMNSYFLASGARTVFL